MLVVVNQLWAQLRWLFGASLDQLIDGRSFGGHARYIHHEPAHRYDNVWSAVMSP